MTGNVSDIRPNFKEDIARTLASVYFTASLLMGERREVRFGAALILAGIAIAYGVNPETILRPEDVQMLKSGR